MKRIRVRLGSRGYNIHIGPGLLMQAPARLKRLGFNDKLVIITDPTVRGLYGSNLKQSLAVSGFTVLLLEIAPGEEQKSLETAGRVYQELTDFHAERTTPVLALGGGVIGDLAGFIAATYLRGVPLIQMPTTLLAQLDSSIGGKVAVNHGRLKNKIGAFYQPRLVLADITTLKTLPSGEVSNGLAEAIKCGVIQDAELFAYIESHIDLIKSLDDTALETIVFRSAKIKAEVVEKDETDSGMRHILNYGHTVGHAIESVSDFQVPHGEAVAIGMLAAARIAAKLGILDRNEISRLEKVITSAGLPTGFPSLEVDRLLQATRSDKKIARGKIKFILPRAIGEVVITDEVSPSLVAETLAEYHAETQNLRRNRR